MKKTIAFLLSALMCAAILFASCGEETPEERITYNNISELTSASEIVTSSETTEATEQTETTEATEQTETAGQNEAEFSVDDLVLPETVDVSKCTIIPNAYEDHSAQLKAMGFSEGTDDYLLYNTLLDISCKTYYFKNAANLIGQYGYQSDINNNYYKKYVYEIETVVKNLISTYDVGYPNNGIMPFTAALGGTSQTIEEIIENKEIWMQLLDNEEYVIDTLYEYFLDGVPQDYKYKSTALLLLSATKQAIDFIKPFAKNPLRENHFEMSEEYDEELKKVRLIITTDCLFDEISYPGLDLGGETKFISLSDATIEGFEENSDGTVTVSYLVDSKAAFENGLFTYFNSPGKYTLFLINNLGMEIQIYYHSDYPFFMRPEEWWDTPFTVENDELNKALTLLFSELKGEESYTPRDLLAIYSINVYHRKEDVILFSIKSYLYYYLFPDYYAAKQDQQPLNLRYISKEVGNISEKDLSMFYMLEDFSEYYLN